jgi:hypothetical protein
MALFMGVAVMAWADTKLTHPSIKDTNFERIFYS